MSTMSIQNLSKAFDDFQALQSLSFDVAAGEFITLLGPSGCGKTTLLKLISGFLEPTTGRIFLDGKDVTELPPEKRDTALCFQSYALFPHLTVAENLEFGLRQRKVPASDRNDRVSDVAAKLDLENHMKKLPNQLSGGQQQRVSLGRALVMRPKVILFDEPLSNLDAKLRDQVRVEIRRIQKEYGLTAIYVTHDQAEALAMSDRIVVLSNGNVEQIDTPERLYYCPRTNFVADFIGNANLLEGKVRTAGSQDLYLISTPIGELIAKSKQPLADGPVNLAWRPESAKLNVSAEGSLSGEVLHRAFQGGFTELIVRSSNTVFNITTDRTALREGEIVYFKLSPEDIIVLEPYP